MPFAAIPPMFCARSPALVSMLVSKRTSRGCRPGIWFDSHSGAGPETMPTVKPDALGAGAAGGAAATLRFFLLTQWRTRTMRPWRLT